jgi:asparagine synthase (glutamine-hydrolysing)
MCGITGFLDTCVSSEEELRQRVERMTHVLAHRGPDGSGLWTDVSAGLALGHRRLAIFDLSEHGRQPMHSACGRFCVTYNGEIYNHPALRVELEAAGHRFRGRSDTEVLLAAIVQWGVCGALGKLVGIFAFAVWDKPNRVLTLARDAIGVKPLYYGWMSGRFLFGSELKALRADPGFDRRIDRQSLALYLRHGYVPAPRSIYAACRTLLPGSLLSVSAADPAARPEPTRWWSLRAAAEAGLRERFSGGSQDAVTALEQRLCEAVRLQMAADVPLGAFLSGGIDSSTVVALMQAQSTSRVRTFTIGFEEARYDEAGHARAVAQHLGTEHTEYCVTAAEARDVIPHLPQRYDEPFADASQIPTCLMCQVARQQVTVCLSGDGGDELFCGYDRYFYLQRLWRRLVWCPTTIRRTAAGILGRVAQKRTRTAAWRKLRTLSEFLSVGDGSEFYRRFNTHWREPSQLVEGLPSAAIETPWEPLAAGGELLEQMMYLDAVGYLPDDLLVKVDRASMAVGLEVRVPVLDRSVVEFAWTLPLSWKVRGGTTKWLLRQLLERYLPRHLWERPKRGFGVPLDRWLRGPLRDWAETLLSADRLHRDGFLRPEPIQAKWREHQTGQRDWQYLLWDVLMFQAWWEAQGA